MNKRPERSVLTAGGPIEPTPEGYVPDRGRVNGDEARRAALNLLEDAVEAREIAERTTALLQSIAATQAVLLDINDAIRPLNDPAAIQRAVLEKLGPFLRVDRAYFAEVFTDTNELRIGAEYLLDASPFPEGMRVSDLEEPLSADVRSGCTVVINDLRSRNPLSDTGRAALAEMSFGAAVTVPLMKDDCLVWVLGVHQAKPRDWSAEEVSLIEEVAERTRQACDRARARETLVKTQDRLQSAQEAGKIGLWDWDGQSGKTYWSDTMWGIYGYDGPTGDAEERWEQSLHPEDSERARLTLRRLIGSGGTEYRDEFRIIRPDGSVRWIEGVAQIKRDDQGRALRMAGVNVDITDRRVAEKALRESEERLRLLTDSFQDIAIFSTAVDGTVVTWNPGAQKIFGYAEEEMIGEDGRKLFVPEDRAMGIPESEMATARANGRASDERWHLRKDGSRFYASGIMAPLYDGSVLIGYAKIARDLTAQKQAELELRRQHEELEAIVAGRTAELAEANDALREQMEERRRIEEERFGLLQRIVTTQEDERRRIARDMHDSLGQQLTALRLKLASMKTDLFTDGRIGEGLERLQELGKRIDSEVNFLVWELRPTVLDDLGLAAAIENFGREWSRHFETAVDVHTDRFGKRRLDTNIETNLYRILQEALNNTHKHARARSVNIVLESRRNQVVLVIEDDGRGFDVEETGRVRKTEGGLGLVGMRERAAIIGGTVEIESAPGKGTTVFVRVPIRKGA